MALLVAVGLWYVYVLWGRKGLVVATVGGILSMVVGLAMLFSIVPAPRALTEMSLNGRRELWTASARAFLQKPILGHGFLGTAEVAGNPHNSYLRIFASFGVVGGLLYTALVVGVTVKSALQSIPPKTWVLTALLVAVLMIQMFNQLSFVGISMRSTMIAILMGYGIAINTSK
jgi:O-antigen ligase